METKTTCGLLTTAPSYGSRQINGKDSQDTRVTVPVQR